MWSVSEKERREKGEGWGGSWEYRRGSEQGLKKGFGVVKAFGKGAKEAVTEKKEDKKEQIGFVFLK